MTEQSANSDGSAVSSARPKLEQLVVVSVEFGLGIAAEILQEARMCATNTFERYQGSVLPGSDEHHLLFHCGSEDGPEHLQRRAVIASLEVMARVQNLYSSRGVCDGIRMGIALLEGLSPGGAELLAPTVERAREASQVAQYDEIVTDSAFAANMGRALCSSHLGESSEDGEREFVSVHSLRGEGARLLQVRRANRRILGREREMEAIGEFENCVYEGEGRVLGLCGAAGAGKSFVLASIVDRWIPRGGLGYITRCRPSTQKRCLSPVASLLSTLAGLTGCEGQRTRHERLRRALRALGCDCTDDAMSQMITAVCGETPPAQLPHRLLAGCIEPLVARATHRPILLVVEDAQFADPDTLRLLAALPSLVARARLLIVISYRAERALGSLRRSLSQEIVLSKMSSEALGALARAQARVDSLDPRLASYLVERSAGNPGRLVGLVGFFAQHGLTGMHEGRLCFAKGGLEVADKEVSAHFRAALAEAPGQGPKGPAAIAKDRTGRPGPGARRPTSRTR